jgi:hypothetical protein
MPRYPFIRGRGHSWRACMLGSRVYPLQARTSRLLESLQVGPLLDFYCSLIRPYDCISTPRLDQCLRYAVQLRFREGALYGQGFPPRLGVVPGSFFNTVHRAPDDTTLSECGQSDSVLQGWHCITTNWATNHHGQPTVFSAPPTNVQSLWKIMPPRQTVSR